MPVSLSSTVQYEACVLPLYEADLRISFESSPHKHIVSQVTIRVVKQQSSLYSLQHSGLTGSFKQHIEGAALGSHTLRGTVRRPCCSHTLLHNHSHILLSNTHTCLHTLRYFYPHTHYHISITHSLTHTHSFTLSCI